MGHSHMLLGFWVTGLTRNLSAMSPTCFPLRLVFAFFLLFLGLHTDASPTTPSSQNSLVTVNSSFNAIISHCYTPAGRDTPNIQPVELEACKEALAVLVRTPDFTTRFRFSKNPRAMAIKVPIGWQLGTEANCRIIVNCENDRDTAALRYADIARIAKRIMDNCVDKPDPYGRFPMLQWGGVDGITGEDTFYVAVAKPIRPAQPSLEVRVTNKTVSAERKVVDEGVKFS